MLSLSELKTLLDTADLKNKCTYDKATFAMYIDSAALDEQDLYTVYPVDTRWWVEYSDTTNKFTLQINYFNSLGDGISLQDFITGIAPYPSTQPNNNMSVKYGQQAQNGILITWSPPFAGSNTFTISIPPEMPDPIRRTWSSRYSTITKIA